MNNILASGIVDMTLGQTVLASGIIVAVGVLASVVISFFRNKKNK